MLDKNSLENQIISIGEKLINKSLNVKFSKEEFSPKCCVDSSSQIKLPILFILPMIIQFIIFSTIDKKNNKEIDPFINLLGGEYKDHHVKGLFNWLVENVFPSGARLITMLTTNLKDRTSYDALANKLNNLSLLSCMVMQEKITPKNFNFVFTTKNFENIISKYDDFLDEDPKSFIFTKSSFIGIQKINDPAFVIWDMLFELWDIFFEKKMFKISVQPLNFEGLYLHKFEYEGLGFGIISRDDHFQDSYEKEDIFGRAYCPCRDKELNYEIWEIREASKENTTSLPFSGFYLFMTECPLFENLEGNKDKLHQLLITSLYSIAKDARKVVEDYNLFIDDPSRELTLEDFNAGISKMSGQPDLDLVVSNQPLYKSLIGLDSHFSDSEVKEAKFDKSRRKLVNTFRNLISPDLERILIEANDEFEDLCNDIQYQLKKKIRKGEILKEQKDDAMLSVAQETWDNNDFKYIFKEDLEDIDCESTNNRKRGSRGRFLVKIAERNNKELSEKVILKKLNISR